MGVRRAMTEGVTSMRVDSLLRLAERLLRMFVMLLALSSADLVMADNVWKMQEIVNQLERMLCDLNSNDCEDYSYHLSVNFSGERGRPKIVITQCSITFSGMVSQHLHSSPFVCVFENTTS
jgi:hypothetical protein